MNKACFNAFLGKPHLAIDYTFWLIELVNLYTFGLWKKKLDPYKIIQFFVK